MAKVEPILKEDETFEVIVHFTNLETLTIVCDDRAVRLDDNSLGFVHDGQWHVYDVNGVLSAIQMSNVNYIIIPDGDRLQLRFPKSHIPPQSAFYGKSYER